MGAASLFSSTPWTSCGTAQRPLRFIEQFWCFHPLKGHCDALLFSGRPLAVRTREVRRVSGECKWVLFHSSLIVHVRAKEHTIHEPQMTNLKCPLKTKQHSCSAYLLFSRLEHRYLSTLTVLVSLLCPLTLALPFAFFLFSGDRVDVAAMSCTCLRETSY